MTSATDIRDFMIEQQTMAMPDEEGPRRPPTKPRRKPGDAPAAKKTSLENYATQRQYEAAMMRHMQESPTLKRVGFYHAYWSMLGRYQLAYNTGEVQCDAHIGLPGVDANITAIGNAARWAVQQQDAKQFEQLCAQVIATAQKEGRDVQTVMDFNPVRDDMQGTKKFGIPQDDTFGKLATEALAKAKVYPKGEWDQKYKYEWNKKKRELRKAESIRVCTYIIEHYTHMGEVEEFFRQLRSIGKADNFHDVMDAILLALARTMAKYAEHVQKVLGPKDRGQTRPIYACLTSEQRHGDGTLRDLGLDPGQRNVGLCFFELVETMPVPEEKRATSIMHFHDWVRGDPEPCFRILLLEFIDLASPWSETKGHALVSLTPCVPGGEVMRPEYDQEYKPLTHWFYPSKEEKQAAKRALQEEKKRAVNERKRKREEAKVAAAGEGQQPKRKRLRKLDGTAAAAVVVSTDMTPSVGFIDLTDVADE